MISSLQELIAPITQAEFNVILRDRVLTLRRGLGVNRFSELFDWNRFCQLIDSNVVPPNALNLTKKRQIVPPAFYWEDGKINTEKLTKELNRGASFVVKALDPYVPALDALCADIRAQYPEKIRMSLVITTGTGGAYPPHYDREDLIILQLEGTKQWLIHDSPAVNPVKGVPKLEPEPAGEPAFNEIVSAGDFLFVPAGYWHECHNGAGRSIHLAISFLPPCGWNAVEALVSRLPLEDLLFRVPLTRFAEPAAKAAHVTALKTHLIEKIQGSLSELIEKSLPIEVKGAPAGAESGE